MHFAFQCALSRTRGDAGSCADNINTGLRGSDCRTKYRYDPQHQLISTTSAPDPAIYAASFEYSAAGRLHAAYIGSMYEDVNVFPRDVLYDYETLPGEPATDPAAVRRLVSRSDGTDRATFDYDARGNLVFRAAEEKTHFVYDGDDRLREATVGSQSEVYYYDHNGQRILAATIAGNSLERVRSWFGGDELWYRTNGEVEKTLVHVGAGAMPVARIEDRNTGDPEFTYHGVLGHLLAAVSSNGNVEARFGYGPYGEILYADGPDADTHRRRFNGKELDELTRLAYYGYRYYDRLSLTWTQADPLYRFVPDLGYDEPRRSGLYTFSLNNPLRYVDPNGLDGEPDTDSRGRPAVGKYSEVSKEKGYENDCAGQNDPTCAGKRTVNGETQRLYVVEKKSDQEKVVEETDEQYRQIFKGMGLLEFSYEQSAAIEGASILASVFGAVASGIALARKAAGRAAGKLFSKGVPKQVRQSGAVHRLMDGGKTLVVAENHLRKDIGKLFAKHLGKRNFLRASFWKHILPHRHVYGLSSPPAKLNMNWRKTFQKAGAKKTTLWPWQRRR